LYFVGVYGPPTMTKKVVSVFVRFRAAGEQVSSSEKEVISQHCQA
jgi:hypothetical protein